MSQLVLIEPHVLSSLIKKAVIDGYDLGMKNHSSADVYMTEKEAADYIRLASQTLRVMRADARGPVYSKLGGSIRYKKKDLDAYNDKNKVFTHG